MEGLIASALVVFAALGASVPTQADGTAAWRPVWQRLNELARMDRSTPRFAALARELSTLASEREKVSRAQHDRVATLRARLLRSEVARLSGRASRPIPDPQTTMDFLPGEAWLAARHVAPSALRVDALAESIREARGAGRADELAERVDWAEHLIDEETGAGRIDLALASAQALDGVAHDARSGRIVAGVLRLHGDLELAEARLDSAWNARPTPEERVRLLEERAWLHEGGGPLEQRWLGAAIAAGSAACRWSAAEQAAAANARNRSQVVFRSLLNDDAYSERAWRGLGIGLLAARAAESDSRDPEAREPRNP